MTLIVGLNLSDRVYLAGDTRVTFPDGSYKDDVIKVAHLSGEPHPLIGQKNPNTLYMAVAGSLNFATYLCKAIRTSIHKKSLPDDVRELYGEIEGYIIKMTDEWLKTKDYSQCCIIFAGMSDIKKKEVDLEKLKKLEGIIKRNVASPEELKKVKKQLENEPFFQELAKKIPRKNLMRPFEEPDAMVINPILENAIKEGEGEIDAPDSLVFSVRVTSTGVSREKAEWGEFLAYGTNGLTNEDLAEDFLARMELSPGQLVNEKDMMESSDIRSHIFKIAEKKGVKQIGGIVTPVIIRDNMYQERFGYREGTLDGKVTEEVFQTEAGIFFRKGDSQPVRLIDFFDYNSVGSDAKL
jgi:hypothetical protein